MFPHFGKGVKLSPFVCYFSPSHPKLRIFGWGAQNVLSSILIFFSGLLICPYFVCVKPSSFCFRFLLSPVICPNFVGWGVKFPAFASRFCLCPVGCTYLVLCVHVWSLCPAFLSFCAFWGVRVKFSPSVSYFLRSPANLLVFSWGGQRFRPLRGKKGYLVFFCSQ